MTESRLRRKLAKVRDDLMKEVPSGVAFVIMAVQEHEPKHIFFSGNVGPEPTKFMAESLVEAMDKMIQSEPEETRQ
jgi:hypothetical protein